MQFGITISIGNGLQAIPYTKQHILEERMCKFNRIELVPGIEIKVDERREPMTPAEMD